VIVQTMSRPGESLAHCDIRALELQSRVEDLAPLLSRSNTVLSLLAPFLH